MNKSTLIIMLCAAFASCTKEAVLPTTNQPATASISDNASVTASATFVSSVPGTIYLTAGLNTIQTGNFSIAGQSSYISKFSFAVTNQPVLGGFKFYVDGAQFPATISYSNNEVIVAVKKAIALQPGDHSYILQAKTNSISGSSFSISLTSANIVTAQRTAVNVLNLPSVGNTFIMN